MSNKLVPIPSMRQIESDAKYLSNFNGSMESMINNPDGYDDEEYDGFDDDDLSFDGRSRSFHDQHTGQRLLALTINNSANATDVTVGLFKSFKGGFNVAAEGATTSIEATAITVTSNGFTKLVDLQEFAKLNPLKIVGLRINFTLAAQAGKIISFAYQSPFESVKETILQPESYRSERNNQDKIITIPVGFTLGNQTDLKVQVAANEKLSLFIMFGGIYNTAKSLSKKHDRAASTMSPAVVMGR